MTGNEIAAGIWLAGPVSIPYNFKVSVGPNLPQWLWFQLQVHIHTDYVRGGR
jgi:hypothetical protein